MAFMQISGAISQAGSSMSELRVRRSNSLKSFMRYMRQYRRRMLLVGFLFAISNVLLAVIPLFIGRLTGALAAQPVNESSALLYMWLLIFCSTAHDISWRSAEFAYMKLLNPLPFRYETLLFGRVISQPYPYFVDKFTGKLASYITTITQEMRSLLEAVFYNYLSQVINLIAIAAILTSVNWQTGLVFLVGIVLMVITGRVTIRNSLHYEKLAADTQSTKNGKLFDAIANFVNVKSFRKHAQEISTIEHEQSQNIAASTKSFAWAIFFWGTMSFFIRNVIWPITIALNVHLFLDGRLSIEQLATLLATVLLFSTTIWEIIWNLSQFNLKFARAEEAHTYLFGKQTLSLNDTAPTTAARPLPVFRSKLTLHGVRFAYPDKSDLAVLEDINLTITKGEKVGIVGKSGSGKSTLTKLLLGYYPVAEENVLLDDATITTGELARLVSYVPQDTSLFHRTIGENIAYAADGTPAQREILHAAKQAHAHEFIQQVDGGYDALVGERGVKLSAGQRQRIAIARAFLDDKPILILDEATSALDSESEILVQRALEKLWEDKTVIAIAHRLSTLRNMDRILVMDAGAIIEQGSHAELLKQKGAYAALWSHQSDGFIED
jgi:ATP-binding cassette subfamily B protein